MNQDPVKVQAELALFMGNLRGFLEKAHAAADEKLNPPDKGATKLHQSED